MSALLGSGDGRRGRLDAGSIEAGWLDPPGHDRRRVVRTPRTFTARDDRVILEGRSAGRSWTDIGKQIGTTGKACQYRLARGLGVPDPKVVQVGRREPEPASTADPRVTPRPAGDPVTWNAIIVGTVLEGNAYR